MYGLNDAARIWYLSVWEKLEELECGEKLEELGCEADYGVFMWYEGEELAGLIEIHVDDFLWAGNASFETSVITLPTDRGGKSLLTQVGSPRYLIQDDGIRPFSLNLLNTSE